MSSLKPEESPPLVSGCDRKNYAVLIVIGVANSAFEEKVETAQFPREKKSSD
jgi:hypothetical protein